MDALEDFFGGGAGAAASAQASESWRVSVRGIGLMKSLDEGGLAVDSSLSLARFGRRPLARAVLVPCSTLKTA